MADIQRGLASPELFNATSPPTRVVLTLVLSCLCHGLIKTTSIVWLPNTNTSNVVLRVFRKIFLNAIDDDAVVVTAQLVKTTTSSIRVPWPPCASPNTCCPGMFTERVVTKERSWDELAWAMYATAGRSWVCWATACADAMAGNAKLGLVCYY